MSAHSASTDHPMMSEEAALSGVKNPFRPEESSPEPRDSTEPGAKRRLASQFVSSVGVAFGIVALQLGQGILLARILGPTGRGEYATAVFFVQMLLYIGLLGGLEVICRHAAVAEMETVRLRRAALWLGITTGAITTAVAVTLSLVGLPAEKRFLIPAAIVCSLSIAGQQVMLIMTAVDRGRGEFGAYNSRRLVAAAAFPVLLLIAHFSLGVTLEWACGLFVLASLISMAACLVGVPKPFTGPSEPRVGKLLHESRPYALSMLATDLFERLDLLLILWIAGLQDQGFYAAMVPAVYPLTVIPNTLGMFLFNAGADGSNRLSMKALNRIMASSLLVQTLCTVVFMLLIGTVVGLLYGEDYLPAVQFAWWLAPVAAIKGVLQGLDSYVKGRGRPLVAVRCRVVSMCVMIVATFLLNPTFGAVSVAIAALISQVVCLLWLSTIVYADVRNQGLIHNSAADSSES